MAVDTTESQLRALRILEEGNNVFLTGKPGTGKTFLINEFCNRQKQSGKKILMTASTGIAASSLDGGKTIHSTLGWKLCSSKYDYKDCAAALYDTDILFIDEASMLTPDILAHLYKCLSQVDRRLQVVMVGDFFQLPPVMPYKDRQYPFESAYWQALDLKPCLLEEVVRQEDAEFKRNLEYARFGDRACLPYFNGHALGRELENAVTLCTRRADADEINKARLENLPGKAKLYHALGDTKNAAIEKTRIAPVLSLKKGMRVMALMNDRYHRYQNGSMGEVLDMDEDVIHVLFDNGNKEEIRRASYEVDHMEAGSKTVMIRQFPLCGSYAITIHRSQGQTLERVNIRAPRCWEPGQMYVALSRARTIDGLCLTEPIRPSDLKADRKVVEYYAGLKRECAA